MKKSRKFILGIIVLLLIAIAVVLAFPDLFDKEDSPAQIEEIENVDDLDNPFD